ncbi:MAG: AbrB family transcriptional regulator [Pseudomonadota bacterium]
MILSLIIAAVGGWLASLAGIPLPWMLGAIGATLVAALARLPVASPRPLTMPMRAVLGVLLGAAITPELLAELSALGFALLAVPFYVIVTAALGLFYFIVVAKMDRSEAFFAALPGGLYTMVTFAEDLGISIRRLGLIHTMRVTLIVLVLPFLIEGLLGQDLTQTVAGGKSLLELALPTLAIMLVIALAGWWLAERTKLPGGIMIIPMLITAALQLGGVTSAAVPTELVIIAQVVLGASIGGRFIDLEMREITNALLHSCGYVALALVVTTVTALVLAASTPISLWAGIIGFAPGGLAEMSLVALGLGLNVGFVVTIHISRILFVVLTGPVVYRLLQGRLQKH